MEIVSRIMERRLEAARLRDLRSRRFAFRRRIDPTTWFLTRDTVYACEADGNIRAIAWKDIRYVMLRRAARNLLIEIGDGTETPSTILLRSGDSKPSANELVPFLNRLLDLLEEHGFDEKTVQEIRELRDSALVSAFPFGWSNTFRSIGAILLGLYGPLVLGGAVLVPLINNLVRQIDALPLGPDNPAQVQAMLLRFGIVAGILVVAFGVLAMLSVRWTMRFNERKHKQRVAFANAWFASLDPDDLDAFESRQVDQEDAMRCEKNGLSASARPAWCSMIGNKRRAFWILRHD